MYISFLKGSIIQYEFFIDFRKDNFRLKERKDRSIQARSPIVRTAFLSVNFICSILRSISGI